jgi:hypothetical protein
MANATTTTMTVAGIDEQRLREATKRLAAQGIRYRRLWAYFKNPMRVTATANSGSERPYRQAQEWGLPPRITGFASGSEPLADAIDRGVARKEVVIENDIAWRIDTMVDYLFGKPLVIASAAPDPGRREAIGRLLRVILANNGGIGFLQQLALFGAVYGFVDVLVKVVGSSQTRMDGCGTSALGEAPVPVKSSSDGYRTSETRAGAEPAQNVQEPAAATTMASSQEEGAALARRVDESGTVAGAADGGVDALLERAARMIRFEIVEPARALPLLSCEDYRVVEAYGQVWEAEGPGFGVQGSGIKSTWWSRFRARFGGEEYSARSNQAQVIELIKADSWARWEEGKVVSRGGNSLGEIPLVHIQNSVEAFSYAGASDVEPLIPLQDELNTRLSDRAYRITLQSFKMYLAKGMEGFIDHPVSPGRMWMTENEQAKIEEFGGDSGCPSEEAHISDLREALDKVSGVTPIAAGAIKNRIGRLTSAAALRVTLLALLSKTDKKRTLYGAGIERLCELALRWLDVAGVFKTSAEERRVELSWPSPLPENEMEKLQEADAKIKLGVDRGVVLRELGY